MCWWLQRSMSLVPRTTCGSAFQRIFFMAWTGTIFASVTSDVAPRKPKPTTCFTRVWPDAAQWKGTPRTSSATWIRWKRFPFRNIRSSPVCVKWKSPSPATTQTWESCPLLASKSKARRSFSPRRDTENSSWKWTFSQITDSRTRTRRKISQLWCLWGSGCSSKLAWIQTTGGWQFWQKSALLHRILIPTNWEWQNTHSSETGKHLNILIRLRVSPLLVLLIYLFSLWISHTPNQRRGRMIEWLGYWAGLRRQHCMGGRKRGTVRPFMNPLSYCWHVLLLYISYLQSGAPREEGNLDEWLRMPFAVFPLKRLFSKLTQFELYMFLIPEYSSGTSFRERNLIPRIYQLLLSFLKRYK